MADIGPLLKGILKDHFKKLNEEVNIKYIDPSYIIRSVKANSDDAVLCMTLSQTAAHAAMTGKIEIIKQVSLDLQLD